MTETPTSRAGFLMVDEKFGVYWGRCEVCGQGFGTTKPEVVKVCGACEGRMPEEHRRNVLRAEQEREAGIHAEMTRDSVTDSDRCKSIMPEETVKKWERRGYLFHDRRRWA